MEKQRWAIFDLDNTIADMNTRLNLSMVNGKLDYEKLHHKTYIAFDEPMYNTIDLINSLTCFNVKIFILTGRYDSTRKETLKWLHNNDVYFDKLVMKSNKDKYVKSEEWKEKQMHKFMEDLKLSYEQIILSSDDHSKNQTMFESWGIPCLDPNVLCTK